MSVKKHDQKAYRSSDEDLMIETCQIKNKFLSSFCCKNCTDKDHTRSHSLRNTGQYHQISAFNLKLLRYLIRSWEILKCPP